MDKSIKTYIKYLYGHNIDLPGELINNEDLKDFHEACNETFDTNRFPEGTCQKCGDKGEWIMLGCFCRNGHGQFMG